LNHSADGASSNESEDTFFTRTYQRLVAIMVSLALLSLPAVWIWYGRAMALVFSLGSAIALVNFYWLRRSIEAMGARLDSTGRPPSRAGIILRFLLRYVLIAAAAYAILKSTASSLNGLFLGLSLPVGAILIEAVYQLFEALRTRTLNPRT
jgi:hypothetical protein